MIVGMYTEIYVNADLKQQTPQEIIDVLKAICDKEFNDGVLSEYPSRFGLLFNNGSYYLPNTECGKLTYDEITKSWSIIGKGDIKNYESEIEQFFELIKPWCENRFIGYHMYEEDDKPTLVYAW